MEKKSESNIIDTVWASKKLNKALMDSLPYAALLITRDRVVVAANRIAKEIGVETGKYCWDTFGKCASIPQEAKDFFEKYGNPPVCGTNCTFCQADKSLFSQKAVNKQITAGDVVWDTFWVPVSEDIYLHYAIDITSRGIIKP